MLEIYELKDKVEHFDKAVQLFWKQWGTEKNFNFYHNCMLHSINVTHNITFLPYFKSIQSC